jgi:hypothetical protein
MRVRYIVFLLLEDVLPIATSVAARNRLGSLFTGLPATHIRDGAGVVHERNLARNLEMVIEIVMDPFARRRGGDLEVDGGARAGV